MTALREAYSNILDLLYPQGLYCACCSKIITPDRPYQLCNDCMDSFKWNTGRVCGKCGKKLSENNPRDICFNCAEHNHIFRKGYSCTEYGMHERAILYKLKYYSDSSVAVIAGEAIYDMLVARDAPSYDFIIPVPLHRSRLLERGYNQAELIAKEVSKRIYTPCRNDIVMRVTRTKALKSKSPEERRAELRSAFQVRESGRSTIQGKNILLLDDIYTTGATADAISTIIYEAGASAVDFVSFASGADMIK